LNAKTEAQSVAHCKASRFFISVSPFIVFREHGRRPMGFDAQQDKTSTGIRSLGIVPRCEDPRRMS
jgi:hypothetical protein